MIDELLTQRITIAKTIKSQKHVRLTEHTILKRLIKVLAKFRLLSLGTRDRERETILPK